MLFVSIFKTASCNDVNLKIFSGKKYLKKCSLYTQIINIVFVAYYVEGGVIWALLGFILPLNVLIVLPKCVHGHLI